MLLVLPSGNAVSVHDVVAIHAYECDGQGRVNVELRCGATVTEKHETLLKAKNSVKKIVEVLNANAQEGVAHFFGASQQAPSGG